MINLQLNIRNPYSNHFENIKCWAGSTPIKNKYWEFQIMKTSDIIDIGLRITHRQDHAGVQISFGLLGYQADFNLYDNRHWDDKEGRWCSYDENGYQ